MKFWVQVAAAIFVWIAVPASAGDAPGELRVAFTTSVTGDVILGSWPDADDQTGLAAADRICQNRAAAGGLDNAANFIAWISDSSDDAYCRIHGLNGKKADNCGQPSLPVDAGPWVRTDGFPFAPAIDQLLDPNNVVYTPPRLDEFGVAGPSFSLLTATDYDGTVYGGTCGEWTDSAAEGGAQLGSPSATSGGWTRSIGVHCSFPSGALMCMERTSGPALPAFAEKGRLAFVTSASGTGDLGSWAAADAGSSGMEAGDSICRNLASDAGLPHADSFKVWLSDATVDAKDRFEHDGRLVRLDGVQVAVNQAELTTGQLFTAITQTELGDYVVEGIDGTNVRTGTLADGTGSGAYCQGLTSWSDGTDSETGGRGMADRSNALWTDFFTMPCHFPARLYCLSDLDPIVFSDRFED